MRKPIILDFVSSTPGGPKLAAELTRGATKHISKNMNKVLAKGGDFVLIERKLTLAPTKLETVVIVGGLLLTGFMIGQSTQAIPESEKLDKKDVKTTDEWLEEFKSSASWMAR